jgi:hypothetical protein
MRGKVTDILDLGKDILKRNDPEYWKKQYEAAKVELEKESPYVSAYASAFSELAEEFFKIEQGFRSLQAGSYTRKLCMS